MTLRVLSSLVDDEHWTCPFGGYILQLDKGLSSSFQSPAFSEKVWQSENPGWVLFFFTGMCLL
jgi:hypothetical protein